VLHLDQFTSCFVASLRKDKLFDVFAIQSSFKLAFFVKRET